MALRPALLVPALFAFGIGASSAATRDGDLHRHHRARQVQVTTVAATAPAPYRGLTITRPPETETTPEDQDIYRDGPVRYNDIRDFSPAPYTTSGVQFPYGLDGVGGYGSDLDYGAGQDSVLYDRGAGSRP